ncbi:MAG: hydrolase [Anaerolineaceae bacterium]|jgi:nicotinamidase-related amidase
MLKQEQTLLVIIDVQGNLAKVVSDAEAANQNVHRIAQAGLALELPIILTAQAPEKIGHTTPELRQILPDHHEYPRLSFSVWADTAVRAAIEETGRKQVLLCGFEGHICLYQTAMDMLAEGYEVYMLTDAISSRSLYNKETALRELSAQGVHLTTVEMALFSILRDASHAQFRTISRLIR